MKRLMFVFGTRPEAIKLAPLILKARDAYADVEVITVVTAQHRQMLDDILSTFDITPDTDLNIMAPDQSLFYTTWKIIAEMEHVIQDILLH
jgi:UDP-N-acetylglucosamine 2-epimerase (non-hydrolysing)